MIAAANKNRKASIFAKNKFLKVADQVISKKKHNLANFVDIAKLYLNKTYAYVATQMKFYTVIKDPELEDGEESRKDSHDNSAELDRVISGKGLMVCRLSNIVNSFYHIRNKFEGEVNDRSNQ